MSTTYNATKMLPMSEEMKEEIFAASLEYWINWNYRTSGWEWDEECEWDGDCECVYHEFDNDLDKMR